MSFKSILLLTLSLSSFVQAKGLTSLDSLKSFNCTLSSAAGITKLIYNKDQNRGAALGRRNGYVPVQYNVNAAGMVYEQNTPSGVKSQISLSGGGLARNQYLTMLFSDEVVSGETRAIGTLLLVSMGGSVFAPTMSGNIAVGTVQCSSVNVK